MTEDDSKIAPVQGPELIGELRTLIQAARTRVATAANAELTMLCWRIGQRLLDENLSDGRADYGRKILVTVSQQLEQEFGKGFSYSAPTRMVRFAELFPEERIVVSLVQVLSWTHILVRWRCICAGWTSTSGCRAKNRPSALSSVQGPMPSK